MGVVAPGEKQILHQWQKNNIRVGCGELVELYLWL